MSFSLHTDKNGKSTLKGTEEADYFNIADDINGFGGVFLADGGDDTVIAGAARDEIYGGDGNDYIDGGSGDDTLTGGNGNDTYIVNLTNKGKLEGKVVESNNTDSGIDTLRLRGIKILEKPVTIELKPNIENIDATQTGSTQLNLTGNKSDNILIGNDANNILNGDKGVDTFVGGKGNDTYVLDQALELGGITELNDPDSGIDTLHIDFSNESIALDIDLGTTNLTNVENVSLRDNGLFNIIGNASDNVLRGNSDLNVLSGGIGNDLLDGGRGNDTLSGGLGLDTFVFSSNLSKNNIDTITDFVHGEDKIQLNTAIFKKLLGDTDLSDNFVTDGIAHDSNDYLLYNSTTGALYYDADGSGKGAAVQFATLTGAPILDATDFTLVPTLG